MSIMPDTNTSTEQHTLIWWSRETTHIHSHSNTEPSENQILLYHALEPHTPKSRDYALPLCNCSSPLDDEYSLAGTILQELLCGLCTAILEANSNTVEYKQRENLPINQ